MRSSVLVAVLAVLSSSMYSGLVPLASGISTTTMMHSTSSSRVSAPIAKLSSFFFTKKKRAF